MANDSESIADVCWNSLTLPVYKIEIRRERATTAATTTTTTTRPSKRKSPHSLVDGLDGRRQSLRGVARSRRTTNGSARRRIKAAASIFVAVVFAVFTFVSQVGAVNTGCHEVKRSAPSVGLSRTDVPFSPIVGERLQFCSSGGGNGTCCTRGMEHKLSARCRVDFDDSLRESTKHLRRLFTAQTARFDQFYARLLDNGEKDLNKMFLRTYGALYEQNSKVFEDLFRDLRKFFRGGNVDLGDVMDNFFAELLKKMFQLLNAQYQFDEGYLTCVTDLMEELKPFKDVPQRLTLQVKRSFTAARSFVQALAVGRDVIHRSSELQPSQLCHVALMRMKFCPHCQGLPAIRPCNSLCLNVMKGCLSQQSELDSTWNKFTDALTMLADRLEGPFNIEQVVDPIDVKISEAIMNFQDTSAEVSKRVFRQCGTPDFNHNRRRRSVSARASLRTRRGAETPEASDADDRDRRDALADRRRLAALGITSLRVDDAEGDDVIIDEGGVDPGVPVSFPDAPGSGGARRGGAGGPKNDGVFVEMNYERGGFSGGAGSGLGVGGTRHNPHGESLDFLVREMKSKIKISRSIWTHLPHNVCNNEKMLAAETADEEACWNGRGKGRYEPLVVADGLKAQTKNPEFPSISSHNELLKPNSVIQEQLVALRSMTQRLKNAYNGMDVEWPETEPSVIWAGSGSGDDNAERIDDDDDDKEDYAETGSGIEGSGAGDVNAAAETPRDRHPLTPVKPEQTDKGREKPPKCDGKWVGSYCVVEGPGAAPRPPNGAETCRSGLVAVFLGVLSARALAAAPLW